MFTPLYVCLLYTSLERKGIIADRCEINRQIKADNALLRELKAAVRKLEMCIRDRATISRPKLCAP